ncbi:hypothetical protein BT96DRAFT_47760 [Gymnopus androsaceus JB14]|uniref:LysM domain-containing protein n=1 Tax=Gymnopus androsaceus JB14 TaxID=1447944 RepID=A0A6A4GD55_9AGAR|nr:hypothetical protein BT96DRAFT_47760 [Gymnopus androsaceus JB14]
MFARLSLFALVTALMGTHVLALNCQANYTVVSGDSCCSIAAKFNVSDATLLADNSAVDANCRQSFRGGRKLCIPFPLNRLLCPAYRYFCDNCVAIAAEFGTHSLLWWLQTP